MDSLTEPREIESERDIKLELKGDNTGNKNNQQKFMLFVRNADRQLTAMVTHNTVRVCWTCSWPKAHHRPMYQRWSSRREPIGATRGTYLCSERDLTQQTYLRAPYLLNYPRTNELPVAIRMMTMVTIRCPHYFQSPLDAALN